MPPPSRDSACAEPDQPRQQVLQLRELDLQLAFARPRAPREDVEDELRAVDDLAVERLLEVAQLRRRQLVVEDDDVDAALRRTRARATSTLPLPRNVAGSGLAPFLQHAQHDVGAGRGGETGELVERMFGIEVAGRAVEEADERRTLARARARSIGKPKCASLAANSSTRSHAIAPARTSTGRPLDELDDRRRRAAGRWAGIDEQVDALAERGGDFVGRHRRRPARSDSRSSR